MTEFPPTASTRRWIAATLITVLPLTFALSREMWDATFPIDETVGLMYDAGILEDGAGSPHTLDDPTLMAIVDPTTRSWYRPLYWVSWYGFWHATHSIDGTIQLFRLFEVATTALLVIGFVLVVCPRSIVEYAAALVAVAVFVGSPGFRENLEIPLLMTLVGMLFALVAWGLLERKYRWWHGPALVLLTAMAVGFKEQGLVLVPIIVGAWWAGAPGVRRSTAVTLIGLTLAYLWMRLATAGSWRPFEQDIGLGFEMISASAAAERFGDFPYWIYAYNSLATLLNILFSEPTDGVFRFVQRAGTEGLRPWEVNHLVSSTLMTALLAWWVVRVWRRDASGSWRSLAAWRPRASGSSSPEFRMAVALVLALAASAALGFNYSRDRLAGMAVVFYALAAFHALRDASLRLRTVPPMRLVAAAAALVLMSAGWQLRALGTVDDVEARAHRAYRGWVAGRQAERVAHGDREKWLAIFAAMERQGLTPLQMRPWADSRAWHDWLGTR